jgi:hypothetical protein
MREKGIYVIKVLAWFFMLFIVHEFLINLNPESFIENWGIGLIGMLIFIGLFVIYDNLASVNAFMITFFAAWLVSDFTDFLNVLASSLSSVFGG